MAICCVPNCKAEATTITNRHGLIVCDRCADEMNGTPVTMWDAIRPRTSLREKLKNLLDNGKLRG